jgi:D-lactate dehydrogenase
LLNEGVLAGVGLDVYQDEKNLAVSLRQGNTSSDLEIQAILELANHPGAITTPHNAFNTRESLERKAEQSIRQIQHFLDRNTFLWNVPD